MSAATLTSTGYAEIDRGFLDSFELQTAIESCTSPFIPHRRLGIRLFEELFHCTLCCAFTDDHEIPRLHEPDRPGVVRSSQDSCKHIVCNRSLHKISSDVPPLENRAVDGCPFMVGELSITGNIQAPTHTIAPEQRLTITVMGDFSLNIWWAHRLAGKQFELTRANHLQTDRTEAIVKSSGNPVHLLFGNPDFSTPALIPTTLECLAAVLTGFVNRPPQNSTPGWALIPFRNGCLVCFISVTRSASSINSSLAARPVITTCCMGGLARRTGNTSSTRT